MSKLTNQAFLSHLSQSPNDRRVTKAKEADIISWLTDLERRPSSQKESNRRNYVRKTFSYDGESDLLLCEDQSGTRKVVTEDAIFDVVNAVHQELGHTGWDATWKALNGAYYGILRVDMIFILKHCPTCATDASKHSKRLLTASPNNEKFEKVDIGLVHEDGLSDDGLARTLYIRDPVSGFCQLHRMEGEKGDAVATLDHALVAWIGVFEPPKIVYTLLQEEFSRVYKKSLPMLDIEFVTPPPSSATILSQFEDCVKQGMTDSRSLSKAMGHGIATSILALQLNTMSHEESGVSPYEIVFGRKPTNSDAFSDPKTKCVPRA